MASARQSKRSGTAVAAPQRRGFAVSVGELLPDAGGVAFRRFGFARGALLTRWKEIVGPVYARWSVPEELRPGRGKDAGATLVIRVEGAFATQMQHVLPQVRERANLVLGGAAVGTVRLVHGAIPRRPARPAPAAVRPASSEPGLRDIRDPDMRAALAVLAAAMAGN
ncbi:MAG: DUF721 domain-containing protein [Thermaurantiacus sp.]